MLWEGVALEDWDRKGVAGRLVDSTTRNARWSVDRVHVETPQTRAHAVQKDGLT